MICGNTQAEIARDTQTDAQEQAQYEKEQKLHKVITLALLRGESVNGCALADRMEGRHDAFAGMVNDDYDFMAAFNAGHLEHYRMLLTTEARTLASVIMGK